MKFRGTLKLLRLFFFPETASDVAERNAFRVCRRRCGIKISGRGGAGYLQRDGRTGDRVLRLLGIGWGGRLLTFACF